LILLDYWADVKQVSGWDKLSEKLIIDPAMKLEFCAALLDDRDY
jgi:hypothetical protein